ncbi:ubiquitin carboxyl-terminal hydrolase family protein [Stylonychia lemnae]|uniref:Ubiquitin carboxyl-terminal hydrolase n=1 Tax=Stylonychia lemnae TaxID=5949 RepID=A0A078BD65_STYLE|nr:ubiquitin carboxyl-terminal hydrolase family protein [Stylonychia lemnae]|eukprot:CDW91152.1 ubiquitin carboxyl-terminal hydrolase family protein [Stylonychia lemnae]
MKTPLYQNYIFNNENQLNYSQRSMLSENQPKKSQNFSSMHAQNQNDKENQMASKDFVAASQIFRKNIENQQAMNPHQNQQYTALNQSSRVNQQNSMMKPQIFDYNLKPQEPQILQSSTLAAREMKSCRALEIAQRLTSPQASLSQGNQLNLSGLNNSSNGIANFSQRSITPNKTNTYQIQQKTIGSLSMNSQSYHANSKSSSNLLNGKSSTRIANYQRELILLKPEQQIRCYDEKNTKPQQTSINIILCQYQRVDSATNALRQQSAVKQQTATSKYRSQTNSIRKTFGQERKYSFSSCPANNLNQNSYQKSNENETMSTKDETSSMQSSQSQASLQSQIQSQQTSKKDTPVLMKPLREHIVLGLKNIGNTCYMNSILQCIFVTPKLTEYFLEGGFKKEYEASSRQILLGKDFYLLLSAIQNAKQGQGVAVPSDLKQSISKKSPQFRSSGQQDAQEFLRCFLEQLNEELNRVIIKPPYQEINFDNLSLLQQSQGWWKYNKSRENSLIQDIFEGQLFLKTQCQICGYESYKFDNYMDLSIPIPIKNTRSGRSTFDNAVQLEDCLNAFIQEEDMEKCGYKCQKCKSEDNFKNQMTVWKYPQILVIHLKRFQYSTSWKQKLNVKVNIPFEIDMRKYAPYSSNDFSQLTFLEDEQILKNNTKYSLYGMCHHFGSLYGGHYLSCNDSIVQQIDAPNNINSESAYLLFYQLQEMPKNEGNFNSKL